METTALAAIILAAVPASAQASWWDKNAAEASNVSMQTTPLALAPPMRRRTDWPASVLGPLLFGAVKLIGPHGHPISANILRPIAGGRAYLVQTRKGTEVVGVEDIIDPLVNPYPANKKQDAHSNPFGDKRLY